MLVTTKSLSLIEQKRLQWAKEREEMVELYGLWGRQRSTLPNTNSNDEKIHNSFYTKNLLPPIQGKNEIEEPVKERYKPEEESETSGYLSDSPKHLNQRDTNHECQYFENYEDQLNNETIQEGVHQQCWSEIDKTENFWENKRMYKNYKNENWAHQSTESLYRQNRRIYPVNRNYWYGTPESTSSDDGSRLRWGDRGVGIGHLWDPVINQPDSRLPQVADSYRQTPKWVEKGLKSIDGNKADILIIHHPDDDQYDSQNQKNYLLGQNAPIPADVIEERERKRKKALEHQNAIRKQLEERELKRKQERENRIKEEKIEEERIRKEQEIERLRYEEEQKKIKQKEELEKKKEEAMREAIELAEKRAREEKRRKKRHVVDSFNQKNVSMSKENNEKLEKILEQSELGLNFEKPNRKSNPKKVEDSVVVISEKSRNDKLSKDFSCQFEEIQLLNNFQFLNVNGLTMDGGLALMLDNPSRDNNILLPPEGVQLALLMSPNPSSRLTSLSPPNSCPSDSLERTLTPSKYRISERSRYISGNKSTQTDFRCSPNWIKPCRTANKGQKLSKKCGTNSIGSGVSQKCVERHYKHVRCFVSSKHGSKPQQYKMSLEDRPKWGINRPSIQYKKQSEKDPYYQRKIKERQKKAAEALLCTEPAVKIKEIEDFEEKELEANVKLLDYQTDDENQAEMKENIFLQNGYRMNSNLSSPMFVPIDNTRKLNFQESEDESQIDKTNELRRLEYSENESTNQNDDEKPPAPGGVGFLTQTQLEAIKQIASLREGLMKLQKEYSSSRSITPFSDKSVEK